MASKQVEMIQQLQLAKPGSAIELAQSPKPVPGPGEVLLRIKVIAMNLFDCKQRDTGMLVAKWPHVLGIEAAGVVEAVGSGVTHVQSGDEAAAWVPGAYQEYVVMPAYQVARKPCNISLEDAASTIICYATAITAIYIGLEVPLPYLPNTTTSGPVPASVLVLGGGAGTGAWAIQLLRAAYPALPIFATGSPKHHARLTALGATQVFDYHAAPSLVADIRVATPGQRGVAMIIDCVGAGAAQTDVSSLLDPAGSKRYAAVSTGANISVPQGVTLLTISGWSLITAQGGREAIPELTKLVEDGTVTVPLPTRVLGHGLANVPTLMDHVKSASGEKLLITI